MASRRQGRTPAGGGRGSGSYTSGPTAGSLGALVVELGLDPTALLSGLKAISARLNRPLGGIPGGTGATSPAAKAEKIFQDFGKHVQSSGKNLAGMGFRMSMAFAPITLAVQQSISTFAEYETEVTKIQNLTSATASMTQKWSKEFLAIGPALGRTPTELAKGMYFIAGAGIVGKEAMELLVASTKASAIGLGEVEHVAKLGAAAMNAYGKENLSASDAVDILAAAVLYGNVETNSLAQSMGRVIPIAATVGAKFYDIAAAIAVATRTGANADQVVTGLRGLLNILAAPAKESQKLMGATKDPLAGWEASAEGVALAFEKAGLSTQLMRDTLQKQGLPALIEMITAAFGDNLAYLDQLIPNIRALTHYTSLAGAQAKNFRQIWTEIKNASGLVDAAFMRTQTTVTYAMNVLQSRMEAAMIMATQGFQPTIRASAESLGDFATALGYVGYALGQTPPLIQGLIGALVTLISTAGPMFFLGGTFKEFMGQGIVQFTKMKFTAYALSFSMKSVYGIVLALGAAFAFLTYRIAKAADQKRIYDTLAYQLAPSLEIRQDFMAVQIAALETEVQQYDSSVSGYIHKMFAIERRRRQNLQNIIAAPFNWIRGKGKEIEEEPEWLKKFPTPPNWLSKSPIAPWTLPEPGGRTPVPSDMGKRWALPLSEFGADILSPFGVLGEKIGTVMNKGVESGLQGIVQDSNALRDELLSQYLELGRDIAAGMTTPMDEKSVAILANLSKFLKDAQPKEVREAFDKGFQGVASMVQLQSKGLKMGVDTYAGQIKFIEEALTTAARTPGFLGPEEDPTVKAMYERYQRLIEITQRGERLGQQGQMWAQESKAVMDVADHMEKLGFSIDEVYAKRRQAIEDERKSKQSLVAKANADLTQATQNFRWGDSRLQAFVQTLRNAENELSEVGRRAVMLDFSYYIGRSREAMAALNFELDKAKLDVDRLQSTSDYMRQRGAMPGVQRDFAAQIYTSKTEIAHRQIHQAEEGLRRLNDLQTKFVGPIPEGMGEAQVEERRKLELDVKQGVNTLINAVQEYDIALRTLKKEELGPGTAALGARADALDNVSDSAKGAAEAMETVGGTPIEQEAKWQEAHLNKIAALRTRLSKIGSEETTLRLTQDPNAPQAEELIGLERERQNILKQINDEERSEKLRLQKRSLDQMNTTISRLDLMREGYGKINELLGGRNSLLEQGGATQLELIASAQRMDTLERASLLNQREGIEEQLRYWDKVAKTGLTEDQQETVKKLQGAWVGVNAQLDLGVTNIDRMTQSTMNLSETISGVFTDVITGLATGTGKLEDAGKNLGKALIGEFIRATFTEKKLFDIKMERNLLSYIPGLGFLGGQATGENLGKATVDTAEKYLSGIDTLFSTKMPQGKGAGFIPQIAGLTPVFAKAMGDMQAAGKSISGRIETAGESAGKAVGGTGTASAAQLAQRAAFSSKLSAGLAIGGTAAILGNAIYKGVDAMKKASNEWGMTANEIRRRGAEGFMTSTGIPKGIAKYLSKAPIAGMGLAGGAVGAIGGGLTAAALAAGHLGGFVGPMGGLMGIGFGALAGGLAGLAVGVIAAIVMQFMAHVKTTETLIRKSFYKVTQQLGYPAMTFSGVTGKQNLNLRMPGTRGGPATAWPVEYDKYVQGIAYAAGAVYGSNIKGNVGRGAYSPYMLKNAILNNAVAMRLGAEDAEQYALAVIKSTAGAEDLNKALLRLQAVSYLPRYAQNMGINTANRLQQTRMIAGELIYAFEDLPKAINSAELATVAFTDRGILELEKFKRALEDAKSAITEGFKSALMTLVDTYSTFLAGQALGKSFADAFNERVVERVLNEEVLGIFLTKASTTFTEAAQALAKGDLTLFEQLRGAAMDYFTIGRKQALDFFTTIAPGIREVQYGLGLTTPGGWINQTGLGLPTYGHGGLIPGPRSMGRLIIAHGEEEVISANDRSSIIGGLRELSAAIGQQQTGGTIVVEPRLYMDSRELDRGLAYGASRQRSSGTAVPQSRLGVR